MKIKPSTFDLKGLHKKDGTIHVGTDVCNGIETVVVAFYCRAEDTTYVITEYTQEEKRLPWYCDQGRFIDWGRFV